MSKNHSDIRDTRTKSWTLSFSKHTCAKDVIIFLVCTVSSGHLVNPEFDFDSLYCTGIHSNLQFYLSELLLFKLDIFLQFRSLPSRLTKRNIYKTIMNNMYNLCYGLLSLSEYAWFYLCLRGKLKDGNSYNNQSPEKLSDLPNVTQLVSDRSQSQFFSLQSLCNPPCSLMVS